MVPFVPLRSGAHLHLSSPYLAGSSSSCAVPMVVFSTELERGCRVQGKSKYIKNKNKKNRFKMGRGDDSNRFRGELNTVHGM